MHVGLFLSSYNNYASLRNFIIYLFSLIFLSWLLETCTHPYYTVAHISIYY